MDIQKLITDLENYGLAVQDVENTANGLIAGINYLFDLIEQEEHFTKKQLLAMREQCGISISQAALTKALGAIESPVSSGDV